MAFTQKLINISLTIANGNFGSGGNTANVSGLRTSVTIENLGGKGGTQLTNCAIYGLPLQLMNQLSTVGTDLYRRSQNNQISVMAGDTQSGMTLVYKGQIFDAYVDAQNMPQVCFRVTGNAGGGFLAAKQVPPISKSGTQQVAPMLAELAQQMGFQFENNGVNATITNPYYPGTPWVQAWRMAKHAGIDMFVDRGTLAITKAGQPRAGGAVAVNRATGMVGYPAFRQGAIIVKTLFNPAIQPGGLIQVTSDLTPANGAWRVNKITYELESLMPHGRWFQILESPQVEQAPAG